MMTKEEVAEVVAYCEANKISYKQRLKELGVNAWSFYDAKRKSAGWTFWVIKPLQIIESLIFAAIYH